MTFSFPEKPSTAPFVAGDVLDIENPFGSRKYLVTSFGPEGYICLIRVNKEKTKIANIRFPEQLKIRLIYHSTHA